MCILKVVLRPISVYENQMVAGVYILAHYPSDSTLRRYFAVDWPIPDMAFELSPFRSSGSARRLSLSHAFSSLSLLLYAAAGHLLVTAMTGRSALRSLSFP